MEEEVGLMHNIRDHHELNRSFQDDEEQHRNIDNNRRHRVRRKLFSDGDNNDQQQRENINNRFVQERKIELEKAKTKWDFDFVRGEPVKQPIRYEWVPVDEQGNDISESRKINEK